MKFILHSRKTIIVTKTGKLVVVFMLQWLLSSLEKVLLLLVPSSALFRDWIVTDLFACPLPSCLMSVLYQTEG